MDLKFLNEPRYTGRLVVWAWRPVHASCYTQKRQLRAELSIDLYMIGLGTYAKIESFLSR